MLIPPQDEPWLVQEWVPALIADYTKQLIDQEWDEPDGMPEQLDELRRQMKAMDPEDVRVRAMTQAMAYYISCSHCWPPLDKRVSINCDAYLDSMETEHPEDMIPCAGLADYRVARRSGLIHYRCATHLSRELPSTWEV